RAGEREGGAGEAHDAEADEGPDGGDVARGTGHQVARRVGGVEPRGEREEARVEVVAQVVLDPLSTADDREPRAETRDAVGAGVGTPNRSPRRTAWPWRASSSSRLPWRRSW